VFEEQKLSGFIAKLHSASPGKSRQKLWLIVASIIVLVLLIIGGIWLTVVLLSRTSQPAKKITALPTSLSTFPVDSGYVVAPSTIIEPPVISSSPTPSTAIIPSRNFVVRVHYTKSDTFGLKISNIAKTTLPALDSRLDPSDGSPYSIVRVLNASGGTISEQKFVSITKVNAEAADPKYSAGIVSLPESDQDIVFSLPDPTLAKRIEVISSKDEVYDSKEFNYDNLPSGAVTAQKQVLGVSSSGGGSKFIIAITNEAGAGGKASEARVVMDSIVKGLDPWKKHADQIEIVMVPNNNTNLGCVAGQGSVPGMTFPQCSNTGFIESFVAQTVPNYNVILVATNIGCGPSGVSCGTTPFGSGSPYASLVELSDVVGWEVISHELGHAVGHLADEYADIYPGNMSDGPNCFASESDCQTGIQKFSDKPGAKCSLGCNNPSTWRPSTQIMHCTYDGRMYGPLEECLLNNAISGMIGGQSEDCGTGQDNSDKYWGWHR
jgi:hypothetical protein